jgi:presenilin-like A22 family membrane protease
MVRAGMAEDDVVIEHPNRAAAASKTTRAIVVLLLLVSALLVAVITVGGWDALTGARSLQVVYVVLYVFMALLVVRWNRGVLPVAAALALVLLIFAAVAAPGWFERDKTGFASTGLNASVLGLLTLLLIPVQALLIAFALQGFRQAWNVEVERRPGSASAAMPAPA